MKKMLFVIGKWFKILLTWISPKLNTEALYFFHFTPAIIDMGCFDRVETNGGAFEQVNLLFGENPNTAVREWTAPFHKAGIQTHMLERGLNALRMNPVPADVRELMYKVKKALLLQGLQSYCYLQS